MQITSPARHFDPPGECIYCGQTDDLRREHIIPESLGGNLILTGGSCRKCEGATSAVEKHCARDIFGKFRATQRIRRKKGKAHPPALELHTSIGDGPVVSTWVATEDYPQSLHLLRFERPGILRGLPPTGELHLAGPWTATAASGRPAGEYIYSEKFRPDVFARMLAKVGHAFAIAVLPRHELDTYERLLPDYILGGRQEYFGYVVGGEPALLQDPSPSNIHALGLLVEADDLYEYLVVTVRLFANWGAPQYYVVFGRRPRPTSPPQAA